jgi:hypothetical protein
MAEQIFTDALTTVQRIKDRLGITVSGFDTLILRLINSSTDFLKNSCSRNFKKATYTNEVYSINNHNQSELFLKNFPVVSISKLEYMSGTPSNKTWIDFGADNYELENNSFGIVKVYGTLPKGINTVRATYIAGYDIDFTKDGDRTGHNIPADLTDLCERLVSTFFKKRESEGKLTESFNGGTTTWKDILTKDDKDIIKGLTRTLFF